MFISVGLLYAKPIKAIDKKQDKILSKVQEIRYREIIEANRKFDWSDENAASENYDLIWNGNAIHKSGLEKLKSKIAKVFGDVRGIKI